jgi:hypothetical protein
VGRQLGGSPRRHQAAAAPSLGGKANSSGRPPKGGARQERLASSEGMEPHMHVYGTKGSLVDPRAVVQAGEPAGQPADPPGGASPGSRSRPRRSGLLRRPLVALLVLAAAGALAAGCGSNNSGSGGSSSGGGGIYGGGGPASTSGGQSGVATVQPPVPGSGLSWSTAAAGHCTCSLRTSRTSRPATAPASLRGRSTRAAAPQRPAAASRPRCSA